MESFGIGDRGRYIFEDFTAKFKIGDPVEREIDIWHPTKGYNQGIIIKRYSKPISRFGHGPYPELYAVRWNDGIEGKGFLPDGLDKI